jgi:hypothetical protein
MMQGDDGTLSRRVCCVGVQPLHRRSHCLHALPGPARLAADLTEAAAIPRSSGILRRRPSSSCGAIPRPSRSAFPFVPSEVEGHLRAQPRSGVRRAASASLGPVPRLRSGRTGWGSDCRRGAW